MLSSETVALAFNLATKATEQGKQLSADVDTPLAELCSSTMLFSPGIVETKEQVVEVNQQSFEDYAEETDNSSHNTKLSALVEQVASAVQTHLYFTRNVVLANVKEYAERVEKDKSNFIENPVSSFCVKAVDLPLPLKNSSIVSELKKYSGSMYLEPENYLKFESKGPQELSEFILFGSAAVDADILKWINTTTEGTDTLTLVWEEFFTDPIGKQAEYHGSLIDAIEDKVKGWDTALAIFLLARAVRFKGLGNDLPAPEKEVAKTIDQYMDATSTALLNHIARYSKNIADQQMVMRSDVFNKTIYVNKPVYMSWLSEGGKSEVLLGFLVSGKVSSVPGNKKDFVDNAQEYLQSWDRYVSMSAAQTNNQRMNEFLSSLRSNFFSMLQNREEIEEDMFKLSGHLEAVSAKFEEELSKVNYSNIEQIETTCMALMCNARYYYTPSFSILEDMNSTMCAHPDMGVKEAALTATINYVTDYICDQITVYP